MKAKTACAICATNCRPVDLKKIYTIHINKSINDELQTDYIYVFIRSKRYKILPIVYTETSYGERVLTASRSAYELRTTNFVGR